MTTSNMKTVTRRIAAEMIGIEPATLKKWAIEERGPAVHAKLGDRQQSRTLYAVAEIQKWQRDPAAYERRHRGPRHDRRHRAGARDPGSRRKMKRRFESITMAPPELRDDVYLFPQEWDVPAVIGKIDVGWRYVYLRHLDAPAKLRHAAILADGRVLLPALLWFKTERGAMKAIGEFQRPMAFEHYRETFLVEVAILRSRVVRDSTAAKLIDEMAAIVKATVEGRVSAAFVLS